MRTQMKHALICLGLSVQLVSLTLKLCIQCFCYQQVFPIGYWKPATLLSKLLDIREITSVNATLAMDQQRLSASTLMHMHYNVHAVDAATLVGTQNGSHANFKLLHWPLWLSPDFLVIQRVSWGDFFNIWLGYVHPLSDMRLTVNCRLITCYNGVAN